MIMIITNHILAGALIGLTIKQPGVAIIVACLSHFAMDVVPHFGYPGNRGYGEALKHALSYAVGIGTALTSLAVVAFLGTRGEWLALATGLVAASPDVIGFYTYLAYERIGRPSNRVLEVVHVRFHRAIQWCERPWGVWIELVAMLLLSAILMGMIL